METKSYERNINDKKFKKLRVLLIGSEEMVREVRDTLRQVGHDVITRETVQNAQELYEKELKKFDVVYHMVEVESYTSEETKAMDEMDDGVENVAKANEDEIVHVAATG